MADNYSFDIVSEIDWQEVDNAINQTRKEILSRYDFKGSKSTIEYSQKDKTITILADDDLAIQLNIHFRIVKVVPFIKDIPIFSKSSINGTISL